VAAQIEREADRAYDQHKDREQPDDRQPRRDDQHQHRQHDGDSEVDQQRASPHSGGLGQRPRLTAAAF